LIGNPHITERNCIMKDATLAQGNQLMNLILQKKMSAQRFQELFASGFFSDLLNVDLKLVNRRELQRFLCLPPLVQTYEVTTVSIDVIRKMVKEDGVYKAGGSAVPEILVIPQRFLVGEKETVFLLQLNCEDFLQENDENIDRNITETEALREMKKRGYEPGGLLEMTDLLTSWSALRESNDAICAYEVLLVNGVETMCSIIWQAGHLAIRTKLDGNCGNNCRFLAKRQY